MKLPIHYIYIFFPGSLAPATANKNKPQAVAAGGGAADDDDADLQARLDDLRRDQNFRKKDPKEKYFKHFLYFKRFNFTNNNICQYIKEKKKII